MHVRTRIDRAGLLAAMALPTPLQRLLAGPPITVDGGTLAPDVQLSLRLQRLGRIPGAETLPIEKGRELLRRTTEATGGELPIGSVRPLEVAGLPARLYVPSGLQGTGPLLVFFHGGGFWSCDLDTHDAPCRALAEWAGVRVVSVEYRQGPEHPFPAAHDDALAAYAWVVEHVAELGGDPARLAVGGDSAGGNLSAHVAIEAARRGWPLAVQLLLYPATVVDRRTRSSELFGEGFYLTRRFMDRADETYRTKANAEDPRLVPMLAEVPAGLAPALVHTAGFDPLRDEGEAYAEKLRAAGVEVSLTSHDDQIHAFLNLVGSVPTARSAVLRIAKELADSLG